MQIDEEKGAAYDLRNNVIRIPNRIDEKEYDPIKVAEEVSHFIRRKTRPIFTLNNDRGFRDKYTNEFFGYLGRMIYNEVSGGEKELKHDMNNDDVLRYLRENRKIRRKNEEIYEKKSDLGEEENAIRDAIYLMNSMNLESGRKNVLKHARPYRFASEMELGKRGVLGGIYKLSDGEVRKRFFREDKQYDLRSKPNEAKIKKKGLGSRQMDESVKRKGLEGVVESISIYFILLGVFLIGFEITGSVIGSGVRDYSILGFFILMFGIIGFLFSKKRILGF